MAKLVLNSLICITLINILPSLIIEYKQLTIKDFKTTLVFFLTKKTFIGLPLVIKISNLCPLKKS